MDCPHSLFRANRLMPGHDLVAGYQSGHWDISAYVKNAANKTYDVEGYQNGVVTVLSPPREIGMRLTWRM